MSSEISTYLTGRYITIPVYTLSFKEYLAFKNNTNKSNKELLQDYIRYGGFPLVASSNFDEKSTYSIVEDIYNSVVIKDIVNRHSITNIDLFNRVVRFIVENVGKTFSANSIVNFLKSERRTISVEAIYNYLEWLEKAFVIYRDKIYIQVCKELPKESDREIENLMEIKDNYPKLVVTLDDYACGNINGIKIVHLIDFLLNENI